MSLTQLPCITMKRIRREPGKFEVLKLFAALGRHEGFILGDEESEKKFLESISASLLRDKDNSALLHGLRAEDYLRRRRFCCVR